MLKLKSASEISGFNNLSEQNRKLFAKFLIAFTNAWGIEARKTIKPIAVKYCEDTEGKYLKFDYKIYNRNDWLHVNKNPKTNEIEWY